MVWPLQKQNQNHIENVTIAMNAWLALPQLDEPSTVGFDNMQLLNAKKKQWHICSKEQAQVILLERRHLCKQNKMKENYDDRTKQKHDFC